MKFLAVKSKCFTTTFHLLRQARRKENGQAFILVLILLLVGGLIIAPLLAFVGTGLTTGKVYETKTRSLYAADAGIDDGSWQLQYDEMQSFPTYDPLAYYEYDSSYEWPYTLTEEVNDNSVDVVIQNVWIPNNIPAPSLSQATSIIESEKLVVVGSRNATNDSYKINMIFTPASPEEKENLRVDSIGVYLPPGYHYVAGSSNLEGDPLALWYSVPTVQIYGGNEVVIWSSVGNWTRARLRLFGTFITYT